MSIWHVLVHFIFFLPSFSGLTLPSVKGRGKNAPNNIMKVLMSVEILYLGLFLKAAIRGVRVPLDLDFALLRVLPTRYLHFGYQMEWLNSSGPDKVYLERTKSAFCH